MEDFASKAYLHPDSHAAKLERALAHLGTRAATHPKSKFAYSKEPTVLTAYTRKKLLRAMRAK